MHLQRTIKPTLHQTKGTQIQGFGRLQNNSNNAQSKPESVTTGHPKVVSNKRKQIQSQGDMHLQKTTCTNQLKNALYINQRS